MRPLVAVVLASVLLLAGCASVSVETDDPTGPARAHWVNRYAWGVIGGDIEVEGSNLARVEVDDTLFQMLITLLTGGLYCPTTITVWYVDRDGG